MMYEENFSRDQYGNVLFGLSKQEEGIIQVLQHLLSIFISPSCLP